MSTLTGVMLMNFLQTQRGRQVDLNPCRLLPTLLHLLKILDFSANELNNETYPRVQIY